MSGSEMFQEFRHRVAVARRVAREAARVSLPAYLDQIVIPSSPEPKRYRDVADGWQNELLGPQIPAIEHLAGLRPDYAGPMRFMNILARGHNKSSLEAWIVAWLLIASRRTIHGYVLASDSDQGQLILQALDDFLKLNDWLAEQISVCKTTVKGPAGDVTVLPRDARSAMGLRGNFYIADEFVHWERQKEWTSLVTGLRKVTPCVFVALSNAGLLGSWQHEAFEEAKREDEWVVFHRHGTLASWLDAGGLARDRRLVPPSEAERLFDNHWIDPAAEHDYLRRGELRACADLGKDLIYRLRREYGVDNYVASIDYGARRDRTAMCVMHQDKDRRLIIDRLDVWQGKPGSPDLRVQVDDVEKWVDDVQKSFAPVCWTIDPHQMESTIQKMHRRGLPVEEFKSRGGAGNFEMAQHLRAIVVDQILTWYPHAGDLMVVDKRTGITIRDTLEDELASLRVKKMPYGYRFDHENQKHDDRAVAIGMAALAAVKHPAARNPAPPPPRVTVPAEDDRRRR